MIEHHSWLRDLVRMDVAFEGYNPADSMALTPDTRLDRTVATTVLPEYVAIDPDDDEEDDLDEDEDDVGQDEDEDDDDDDDDDGTGRPPGWSD